LASNLRDDLIWKKMDFYNIKIFDFPDLMGYFVRIVTNRIVIVCWKNNKPFKYFLECSNFTLVYVWEKSFFCLLVVHHIGLSYTLKIFLLLFVCLSRVEVKKNVTDVNQKDGVDLAKSDTSTGSILPNKMNSNLFWRSQKLRVRIGCTVSAQKEGCNIKQRIFFVYPLTRYTTKHCGEGSSFWES